MFHVYVLQSLSTGRHYVGYTSDLTQRLGQHNNGITKSTKNRGPWTLIYQEGFPTSGGHAARAILEVWTGRGGTEASLFCCEVSWIESAGGGNHKAGSSPSRRVSERTIFPPYRIRQGDDDPQAVDLDGERT